MKLTVHPAASPLTGRVTPPGDKSVSHRAAIFGGLAEGTTHIEGFLEAEDTLATLAASGAAAVRAASDDVTIHESHYSRSIQFFFKCGRSSFRDFQF